MKQEFIMWYWYNIKYRKYTPEQRKFLVTFEKGIRARKEVESTIYVLLKLNIVRARLLFDNHFDELKEVEQQISILGKEFVSDMKDLDTMDGYIWRKMFMYFLSNHSDEEVTKVWGAPQQDIVKFRAALEQESKKL